MAEPKRVVTSNATGAVIKYGRTDFTGQFDAGAYTQYTLNEDAHFFAGIEIYHHKVVSAELVEMTAGEKTAATAEHEALLLARLQGCARITIKVPNLAALPGPPPAAGYIVAVEDISGTPGIVVSTATNYQVFLRDGAYTP